MTEEKTVYATDAFKMAVIERENQQYILRLYVTGMTPRSTQAIANIKKICKKYLEGRYTLEVIDLFQNPNLARVDQVVAVPTLIKRLPLPIARIIGELSNTERVLASLDLKGKS